MKKISVYLTVISLLACSNVNAATSITVEEKWLSLSPIFIFLLILLIIFMKLKKDKVSLKDLLLDKDMQAEIETQRTEQIKALTQASVAENLHLEGSFHDLTDPENPNNAKSMSSVSRLLAFISGLISVGLASIITSFFMWNYFSNYQTSDLKTINRITHPGDWGDSLRI